MRVRPRDYLGDQTPEERADINRRLAADWIYRFGLSSAQVLMHVLQKKGAGWPSVAARPGLLRSTKTESGVPGVFYPPAEPGLGLARPDSQALLPHPARSTPVVPVSTRVNAVPFHRCAALVPTSHTSLAAAPHTP